jgi:hypothetical protein
MELFAHQSGFHFPLLHAKLSARLRPEDAERRAFYETALLCLQKSLSIRVRFRLL